ncbi:hypothetical protein H072_4620 [Dactylellina haptotyla CBS 200.50]|uniref:CorA-like transporter domain-containing protein n=1 Tax=Dactylellina haptotyla (strain CBS 200.50) TaxID=1284197 RepID=S8AF22_DACHA|nr:hypothetical protein H072_4620 [Dactylellina haptotyla CBS 200.50]
MSESSNDGSGSPIGDRVWRIWPRDCVRDDRLYTDIDGKHDSNLLSEISKNRLFSEIAEASIPVSLYTSAGWGRISVSEEELENGKSVRTLTIKTLHDLETHLDSVHLESPAQTISYFIESDFSWGRLRISEEIARRLFASFSVHQQFISVLSAFGDKTSTVEQSYLTYFDRIQILNPFRTFKPTDSAIFSQTCGYDLGYLFKYVDRHGRETPKDPFAIRQTGVYHKYDPQTKRSVWIFIQPSESLKERLEALFTRYKDNPIDLALQVEIHFLVVTHGAKNWRPYIKYLEELFDKVNQNVLSVSTSSESESESESPSATKLNITDIRDIYSFTDKLRVILQLIQMNYQLAKKIQQLLRRLRNRWIQEPALPVLTPRLDDVCDRFEQHLYELSGHEARIYSLLERAKDVSGLIQHTLGFKTEELGRARDVKLGELVVSAASQKRPLVVSVAKPDPRDVRSTRISTILAFVFLPGILIASIFATNFFSFNSETKHLMIASNLWIYFLISVPITCILPILWMAWNYRRRMFRGKQTPKDKDMDMEKQEGL